MKSNLFMCDVNSKSIDEMLITIELLEGPSLKQHPKKHVMFIFEVTSIGCHNFTAKILTRENHSIQYHKAGKIFQNNKMPSKLKGSN